MKGTEAGPESKVEVIIHYVAGTDEGQRLANADKLQTVYPNSEEKKEQISGPNSFYTAQADLRKATVGD